MFGVSRAIASIQQQAEAPLQQQLLATRNNAIATMSRGEDPMKLFEACDHIEEVLKNVRGQNLGTMRVTIAANIERPRLLQHAAKVFEFFAGHKERLQIQFKDENGFDANEFEAGVTAGFYSEIAERLQRIEEARIAGTREQDEQKDADDADGDVVMGKASDATDQQLSPAAVALARRQRLQQRNRRVTVPVWVQTDTAGNEYVNTTGGLHPAPWPTSEDRAKVNVAAAEAAALERFRFIGRTMSVAMRDGFKAPLPLSLPFFALAQGRSLSASALLAQMRARGDGEAALPPWLRLLAGLEAVVAELDAIDTAMAAAVARGEATQTEADAAREKQRTALGQREFTKVSPAVTLRD